ncbi:MAG: hypothetical protein WA463_20280, partial [Terriglobales bacterium]
LWPGQIKKPQKQSLEFLLKRFRFSVAKGDLQLLDHKWYVTHSGLLRLAHRRRCSGIRVEAVRDFCEPTTGRWVFRATLLTSPTCHGFVGYGDADPSNVSPLVRGAEMRVAETRAVNRALRKAYGIGICSVEEIGSIPARNQPEPNVRKLPPQPVNGNGGPKLRDQLCLLIRQHRLDASRVKQYAAEFCGTEDIRQASRDQIQSFITHLAETAVKDRDGLLCKLNSYAQKPEAGAA